MSQCLRLKWQGLQAVHLFIEHVMMDHVNYLNKTLQYLDMIRMVCKYIYIYHLLKMYGFIVCD